MVHYSQHQQHVTKVLRADEAVFTWLTLQHGGADLNINNLEIDDGFVSSSS